MGKLYRLVVLSSLVVTAPAAAAERSLHEEVTGLTQDIHRYLEGRNTKEVAVGMFTGPAECSFEAPLRMALVTELEERGIRIDMKARLLIKGSYVPTALKDTGHIGVELNCRILDMERMRTLVEMKARLVTRVPEVMQIVGVTGVVPPAGTEEERHKALEIAIRDEEKRPLPLIGNAVMADAKSPYGLEILVKKGKSDYTSRKPREQGGQALVPIERNEVYAVRLINRSQHEAAVTLTVDGLNVFSFSKLGVRNPSTREVSYPTFLVPARGSIEVHGWPITLKESEELKVVSYGKSAVAELGGDPSKVGVITAQFAAAWPKGSPAPDDERGGRNVASGRGAKVETPFEEVARSIGGIRACVSIRYTR